MQINGRTKRGVWGVLLAGSLVGFVGCGHLTPIASQPQGVSRAQNGEEIVAEESDPTRIDLTEQRYAKRKFIDYLMWWKRIDLFEPEVPEAMPAETMVFGSNGPTIDAAPPPGSIQAELAAAHDYFRRGDHDNARKLFAKLADPSRYPPSITEEARFHEAECLRLAGYYPDAADTYTDVLKKHTNTIYREQCLQHMFEIANYWLDDTREQMREHKQVIAGERWFVRPRFVAWDKSKPLLDREGRAMNTLQKVRLYDIKGPLADKALFLMGSVTFFHENYPEADYYFSQLHETHPNSELAPKAVELGIIAKHLSTGGSDYDGRKSAEARKLVQAAFNNYPELGKKREFLMGQLVNINMQQAEKDFKMAEFYRWKGKPGSAYFMYEMVKRRYPGTPYAKLSDEKIQELRVKHANDPDVIVAPSPTAASDSRDYQVAPRPELAPAPKRIQ